MKWERFIWIFLVLVMAWFLFKSCNRENPVGTVTIEKVTTIDTVKGKDSISYTPSPVLTLTDTLRDSIPVYVKGDTVKIPVPAEFKTNIYSDSIKLDSSGYAYITDSIRGKILGRRTSFFLRVPTTTITKTVTIPQKEKLLRFYIGAQYQYPINYLGMSIGLQTRNDNFLVASYGYQYSAPVYGLSYFVKIKLKK